MFHSGNNGTTERGSFLQNLLRRSALARYISGLTALGVAGSIIVAYNSSHRAAILVTSATLLGAALVFLFDRASKSSSSVLSIAGVALLVCASVFFITFLAFTVSAFAFSWPTPWVQFLGLTQAAAPIPVLGAEDKESGNRLAKWICDNVKSPFSFEETIASFPFENMPVATVIKEPADTSSVTEHNSVGEDYTIMYRYQTDNDDGNDYGFWIAVYAESAADPIFETAEKRTAFIARFGKPEIGVFGDMRVGAGSKSLGSTPFYISADNTLPAISIHWFERSDAKLAKRLCG